MVKQIFILFFIIHNISVLSQNYLLYQKQITKAENFILDSNYNDAVNLYDSLFKSYDFVFVENCYTACQTAVYIKNFDKALYFYEKGIMQGLTKEMFYKDSILKELTKQKGWDEINYDLLRNSYIKKIDLNVKNKIIELSELDQKYRNKYDRNIFTKMIYHLKWKKVLKYIVEDEIIPIIKTYHYPGEKAIGIFETSSIVGASLTTNILLHYFSFLKNDSLNKILLNEIDSGYLKPQEYIWFLDYQDNNNYIADTNKIDKNILNNLNKRRNELGLENVEVLIKKYNRGLNICNEIKKGNYKHIKLGYWCG